MAETYQEYKKRMDRESAKQSSKQTLKQVGKFAKGITVEALEPTKPTNIKILQARPQPILSKEQRMLGALFNNKHQLWGNGEPVVIERTLQTGGGLIKTGTGNQTRRLFLP